MFQKNILLVSDPNELVGQFKTEVQNMIQSELQVQKKSEKQNSAEYLTRSEVATHLRISLSTLNRLTNRGILKYYKIGRRSLFLSSDVEATLVLMNKKVSCYGY
jgi:excisionase family DNA binding protein